MRKTKGGPSGGHRTRGFVPHPWKKCRQCWHRVDPRCIHRAPAGQKPCDRAAVLPGAPKIYEKHAGGAPCCPGICEREDQCGRCQDRAPEPCDRPDRCGRCEDRCPPECDREDGCGRCRDRRPRACRRPDACGRCRDRCPSTCPRSCGRCRDKCPGGCPDCGQCEDRCTCSQ